MTVKIMKDRRKNLIVLTALIIIVLPIFFFIISPYFATYTAQQISQTSIMVAKNSSLETTSTTTTHTSKTQEKSIKSLTYVKKGGVRGVYNILEISKPNDAIYTCIFSPRFGNRSFTLSVSESEVESLFEKIIEEYMILNYNGKVYKARQIYDYFTYEIFSELGDGETIMVKWVDEWASEEPIPSTLIHLKEVLEDFIRQRMSPCD
jgi:uncharacterized protein YxeA